MKYADTIVAEIEKKERLLSKRKPKQLFFADEDSIPTESQFHPVSYLLLILLKSQIMKKNSVILIHLMKTLCDEWNTGGNVRDITSEVEMVEKLQNQEICLTIRPEHQDEHHESRAEKLLHF